MLALMITPHSRLFTTVVGLVASLKIATGALIIDPSYDDDLHDRFTDHASFVLNGFDLSGVGQDSSSHWGTAISRNVIISADHLRPTGTITFYPGNDPAATPVTRTITGGMKIANTDFYVATLNSNLPNTIVHYDFATGALSGTVNTVTDLPMANPLYQQNAYLFGLSSYAGADPNRSSVNNQAVGRNEIRGFIENADFLGNTDSDAIAFRKDANGDTNYVTHEAQFASGDSGGPTFVEDSGNLLLIGTNAFTFMNGEGDGSAINYTGNQATAINLYITNNAVPEPGALILGGIAAVPLLLRRRRPRGATGETPA